MGPHHLGVFSKLPSFSHSLPGHHLARPSTPSCHPQSHQEKKRKGKRSQCLDRDRPPLRPWPPQHYLSLFFKTQLILTQHQVKFYYEGFEFAQNTISPLNLLLAVSSLIESSQRATLPSTMRWLSYGPDLMPSTTFTATASSTETSSTLDFPSLSLSFHPHHRPENILYRSKDPNSDIVIVDFGMWVPHPLPTPLFLHLFTEPNSSTPPTNNLPLSPVLSGTSLPKSSKTPATENPSTSGPQVTSLLYTHTRKRIRLIISLHSHHHLRPTLRLPPFLCRQHHRPRPTIRRSQNWISESVLEPGFRTSQIFHPPSRHCRSAPSSHRSGGFTWSLAYPYSHHHHWHRYRHRHRYAIPTSIFLPHLDRIGVLGKSDIALWLVSGLRIDLAISLLLLLLRVGRARKVVGGGMI